MSATGPRLLAIPESQPRPTPPPVATTPAAPSASTPVQTTPEAVAGSGQALTPMAQAQQEAQREKDWYEKKKEAFLAIFLASKRWKLEGDPQKDKKFVFKQEGTNLSALIEVLPNKGIALSGDAFTEIAQAAKSYYDNENTPENPIKFQVEAKDKEQAEEFIKQLGAANFDLDLIKTINLNGNLLSPHDVLGLIHTIKEEIKRSRPVPPT